MWGECTKTGKIIPFCQPFPADQTHGKGRQEPAYRQPDRNAPIHARRRRLPCFSAESPLMSTASIARIRLPAQGRPGAHFFINNKKARPRPSDGISSSGRSPALLAAEHAAAQSMVHMLMAGLEPARLAARDFKSPVSAVPPHQRTGIIAQSSMCRKQISPLLRRRSRPVCCVLPGKKPLPGDTVRGGAGMGWFTRSSRPCG